MQSLEVSCAVRRIYKSLGFKGLIYVPPAVTLNNSAFCPHNVKSIVFVQMIFRINSDYPPKEHKTFVLFNAHGQLFL